MANLDFPSNPTLGQVHTVGGKSWEWSGVAWAIKRTSVPGPSAYQIAVQNGFVGTEATWVASLKGAKGDKGDQGNQGLKGDRGDKGDTGDRGTDGTNGTNGTNGVGVPNGGSIGQVLTKNSSNPYDTSWVTPDYLSDYTVPLGGNQGQFLGKTSGADGDFEWLNLPEVAAYDPELPLGGNTGQVLTKNSTASGDVRWADPTGGTNVPDGGTTGQVLTKNSNFDGDATWQNQVGGIPEAPSDGKQYARKDASWTEIVIPDNDGLPPGGTVGQVLVRNVDGDAIWADLDSEETVQLVEPHRYWRVFSTANRGDSFTGLGELFMRSVVGGSNVTTGGTPFGNVSPIENVFDGNKTTYAQVAGSNGIIFGYDFGAGKEVGIAEVGIAAAQYLSQTPRIFTVQYSDDNTNWYTAWAVDDSAAPAWTTGEVRYWLDPDPVYVQPWYNDDAPKNGKQYARKDGTWTEVVASTGGSSVTELPEKTGQGGKLLAVTSDESGVEWVDAPVSGGSGTSDPYYRMAGFFTTSPAVNEILMIYVVDVDITFPANFSGSQAKLIGMQPGANFVLSIRKNSTTEIGTLTVDTAGVATFITTGGSSKPLIAGDAISIHAPGVSDTISNLTWILRGNK